MSHLDCDHCGGAAVTSDTDEYFEDMASKCAECGFPGHVSIGETYDDEGDEYAEASWYISDDATALCNLDDCAECAEVRAAVGCDSCEWVGPAEFHNGHLINGRGDEQCDGDVGPAGGKETE